MKEILNPDLYHGKHKNKNYFEGWYFKIVDRENNNKLAIIPGISYGKNKDDSHSFIQVLNGKEDYYKYLTYNDSDFTYSNNNFRICICSNIFSLQGLNLFINSQNLNINGNLVFKNLVKWPDNILNPGSMGFYNYLKFMECYSQVCALNASIIGNLNVNGVNINFTGGKAYIEKNWGRSFPKYWLWIQSNSFKNRNSSITCSIGKIPFPIKDFTGFIIGLTLENKFYSFTTMNHSKINIQQSGNDILLTATKRNLRLTLKTYTNYKNFVSLKSPSMGAMVCSVKETLNGQVHVVLEDTKLNKKIFEDIGLSAGIEYGGDFFEFFK